jgi:hypothetical protein
MLKETWMECSHLVGPVGQDTLIAFCLNGLHFVSKGDGDVSLVKRQISLVRL